MKESRVFIPAFFIGQAGGRGRGGGGRHPPTRPTPDPPHPPTPPPPPPQGGGCKCKGMQRGKRGCKDARGCKEGAGGKGAGTRGGARQKAKGGQRGLCCSVAKVLRFWLGPLPFCPSPSPSPFRFIPFIPRILFFPAFPFIIFPRLGVGVIRVGARGGVGRGGRAGWRSPLPLPHPLPQAPSP